MSLRTVRGAFASWSVMDTGNVARQIWKSALMEQEKRPGQLIL